MLVKVITAVNEYVVDVPAVVDAKAVMFQLTNKLAFVEAFKNTAVGMDERFWRDINGAAYGPKYRKFNTIKNSIILQPSQRKTWENGILTWLQYAKERNIGSMPPALTQVQVVDVSQSEQCTFVLDKHEYAVEFDAKNRPFSRFTLKCGVCGADITGRKLISRVDGKFTRFQVFQADNEACKPEKKGGHTWHCPEHSVKVMTPEEFFLGKSAATDPEHAQLSKARLNKLHMQGLIQKIKDHQAAEEGFINEIQRLEDVVSSQKEELSNIVTADQVVQHLMEEMNNDKLTNEQVGSLFRMIKDIRGFISTKGGK